MFSNLYGLLDYGPADWEAQPGDFRVNTTTKCFQLVTKRYDKQ